MDLENEMASMQIQDPAFSGLINQISVECTSTSNDSDSIEEPETSPIHLRRSARLVNRPVEKEKKRVLLKPRKLISDCSLDDIRSHYLDKRIKRLPHSLETIYEEPQNSNSTFTFMSSRKYRRCISFSEQGKCNKSKVKKRSMKAKSVSATNRINNKNFSLDFLLNQLSSLDDD